MTNTVQRRAFFLQLTSAWKQRLSLDVVNSGARTADLPFLPLESCFSEQRSKKCEAAAKHCAEGADVSF